MQMKRHYKMDVPKDDWEPDGRGGLAPPIDYIELYHTGTKAQQNFSLEFIERGTAEGWLSIDGDTLTLDVKPEPLVYRIDKVPGRHCCHCGQKLMDDPSGRLARMHVQREHPDAEVTNPRWAGGYEVLNHYACTLDAAQHDKFQRKLPGGRGVL